MTDIPSETFYNAEQCDREIHHALMNLPVATELIYAFSTFYVEINLKKYIEITCGNHLLILDKSNRTHAFTVLVFNLLKNVYNMDHDIFFHADNYWHKFDLDIEKYIDKISKENANEINRFKKKIDVIIFHFQSIILKNKNYHTHPEKCELCVKVLQNACLELWCKNVC